MKDKVKILELLTMIKEDVENDVNHFEGQQFNGRNVAVQFGKLSACVVGLAHVITAIVEGSDGN